jgi:hypothetical protein
VRFLAGVVTVILLSVGSAFAGQLVGHVASGGDKNAGLETALAGLLIGAAVAIASLTWWGDGRKDWSPVLGGVVAAAIGACAVTWLILPR